MGILRGGCTWRSAIYRRFRLGLDEHRDDIKEINEEEWTLGIACSAIWININMEDTEHAAMPAACESVPYLS
jgi:hypothetical protein